MKNMCPIPQRMTKLLFIKLDKFKKMQINITDTITWTSVCSFKWHVCKCPPILPSNLHATSDRWKVQSHFHHRMLAGANFTSGSFPESPGSLFSENLPETVHKAAVGAATCSLVLITSAGVTRGRWPVERKSYLVKWGFPFLLKQMCLILNTADILHRAPHTWDHLYKAAISGPMKSCNIIITASDEVVSAFFVPSFKTRHLGSWPSRSKSAAYIHDTQVGAGFYRFTINQSIPPARQLFNLHLLSSFPPSLTCPPAVWTAPDNRW